VTKSQPVLNSLSVAFSKKEIERISPPGQEDSPSQQNQLGSTLDRIEALFRTQITATQAKQNRLGTEMHIRMPFKDFQTAIARSLTVPVQEPPIGAEPVDLLPMLVSLLETQRTVPYKMDMVLNVNENVSALVTDNPARLAAYNRSVSEIAFKLEDSGLPRKQLSAGLETGQGGMIDLMFSRYEPFNPLGTDAPVDAAVETGAAQ
ncbi:MAG: hypothetical protein AAF204_01640, partial [Pseudomonadota bacterium]